MSETQNNSESAKVNPVDLLAKEIYDRDLPIQTESFLPFDKQSFLSGPHILAEIINVLLPKVIIEVGSWKGHSAIKMAEVLNSLDLVSSRIICIDTWLGSLENWSNKEMIKELYLRNGYPTLYEKFLNNVILSGFGNYILPLPMMSKNGATFLKSKKIKGDLIYIDAGHDYESVTNDLNDFYPLLNHNGIMFGDDFPCPSTAQAARDFAISKNMGLMVRDRKYILFRNDQKSLFSNILSNWKIEIDTNLSN